MKAAVSRQLYSRTAGARDRKTDLSSLGDTDGLVEEDERVILQKKGKAWRSLEQRLASNEERKKEKADAPRQRQLRPLQTCKVPIGSLTSSWRWIAIRQALGAACRPSSPENAQTERVRTWMSRQ